eukprot:1512988-Pyramimonas_sp.AAC.1
MRQWRRNDPLRKPRGGWHDCWFVASPSLRSRAGHIGSHEGAHFLVAARPGLQGLDNSPLL